MAVLMRHTKLETSRLRTGFTGIHGVWVNMTQNGTATYNMWDVNGCPFNWVHVMRCSLRVSSVGVGDTVVVQHVSTAGAANAMTDTVDLNLFLQDNVVDMALQYTFGAADYSTITKGENIRIVTASNALALVWVEYVIVNESNVR